MSKLIPIWTAAMLAGWRAIQSDGATRDWLWAGLWIGLGFLSKYTNLFQLLCWLVFFALWKPSRIHLRKPGPYLALLVVIVSLAPVLIWNFQHGWITVEHVANNGGLGKAWKPTLRYTLDFLGAEAGLLNPVYFVAMLFACFAMWRAARKNPLHIFLFSMGAPLFLFYFALGPDSDRIRAALPGLFWLAFILAGVLGLGRAFALERENDCVDGLILAPADKAAIYLGKLAGTTAATSRSVSMGSRSNALNGRRPG